MQNNSKSFSWSDYEIIEKLKKSLNLNLINITSTDTIPGLLANITEKSFEKLNAIKRQRVAKPYLILISSPEKIKIFADENSLDKNIENLIKNCWPGPLTIIFKAKDNLPSFMKSSTNTIALRCPKHPQLLKLLESFDGLFSTSANISDQQSPTHINQIDQKILDKIDFIIFDNRKKTLPSTIIDVSKKGVVKIIREGEFKTKTLEKYYGNKLEQQ